MGGAIARGVAAGRAVKALCSQTDTADLEASASGVGWLRMPGGVCVPGRGFPPLQPRYTYDQPATLCNRMSK